MCHDSATPWNFSHVKIIKILVGPSGKLEAKTNDSPILHLQNISPTSNCHHRQIA